MIYMIHMILNRQDQFRSDIPTKIKVKHTHSCKCLITLAIQKWNLWPYMWRTRYRQRQTSHPALSPMWYSLEHLQKYPLYRRQFSCLPSEHFMHSDAGSGSGRAMLVSNWKGIKILYVYLTFMQQPSDW